MPESYAGKINRKLLKKQRIIAAAAGREPADLVLKNATFVNVFSNELSTMDIAVAEGLIVGMGSYQGRSEVDCTGKIVLPGFLDAHIHLESSLVSPTEFVKAVLPHGTTTVVVPWGRTAFTNSVGLTRELSRWMWASRKPGRTILSVQSTSSRPW